MSGLIIGGLILIIGALLMKKFDNNPNINNSKFTDDNMSARILPNGEVEYYIPPKNNTVTNTEKNSTKSNTTGTYFEGTTIPILSEEDCFVAMMTWHKGAQTVEALMDSYHIAYMQGESRRRIDKRIPPEEWLQYLLDR